MGTPRGDGPSPSMLHPSNASAAFLGMHHYMNRDGAPPHVGTMRTSSQGNVHPAQDMNRAPSQSSNVNGGPSIASSLLTSARPAFDQFNSSPHLPTRGSATSAVGAPGPASGAAAPPSAFNRHVTDLSFNVGHGLGLGMGGGTHQQLNPHQQTILSPNSRALQAHAPGQSLPQGLAAGYSRIHLQPPTAFSPGSHGALSDGVSGASPGSGTDWGLGASGTPGKQQGFAEQQAQALAQGQFPTSPPVHQNAAVAATGGEYPTPPPGLNQPGGQTQAQDAADTAGLTSMFSHLSYSSVAARASGGSPTLNAAQAVPLAMSRRSSGQQPWRGHANPHGLSSPLSGPVLTNDDEELFSFDEEK